jgi:hypothetical protein
MIQIASYGDQRVFTVPEALANVAVTVTGIEDLGEAVYLLCRRLTANDLHTVERVALDTGHGAAVELARRRLVKPLRLS